MTTYRLTAHLGARHRSHRLTAEADDFGATMAAIAWILDHAIEDEVWAKGAITLTDPEGITIHEMPAKEETTS